MHEVEINESIVADEQHCEFISKIGVPVTGWKMDLKRCFDLAVGLLGTLLSVPIVIVFAILIKLTSDGPVFYKQARVGWMGTTFDVIKLRSMYQDAEAQTGAIWAQKNDPRVTPVGR